MDWVASLLSAARAALVLIVSAAGVAVSSYARHDLFQPQQTFRTGVDVIQLDVSVLDKDRRPIRGLTAADFTVLEEGRPRPVVAFRAIELPPPVTVRAAWQRDVAEDVVTNAPARGRVVAIVMGLPAALASPNPKQPETVVPVDRLPAGEYLLTIEGAAGALTVHRAVRYHVQ